ncbi:hypothetical protein K378_03063 [Streptomyces sp. Amel2xB2]|uniref:DUF5304 domain-containing protein n=1 Tax=Streptomyces sp. Amel2xB2 TaxID=1305829 RepID=UPI000DBFAAAE|nr:hypothetical protein K378_03063 [Streptomyces sp. Amel2xB2]
MSDAAEPETPDEPDADAWATACEEDLAAEKARRRAEHGAQYGSAAEELRRLADAVSERVSELGRPFAGTVASTAAQGVAQQLIAQAKAAIEPVVERNPQVFDHLAAAGGELLAAYRAAVQEAEGRWTAGAAGTPPGTTDTRGPSDADTRTGPGGSITPESSAPSSTSAPSRPSAPSHPYGPAEPSSGVERIDLDKDPGETGREDREQNRNDDRKDGNGPEDPPPGGAGTDVP